MSTPTIEKWIDMNSPDFNRIDNHVLILKIINVGVESGIITVDNAGYMWKDNNPIHAELDGGLVGLRYSAKAVN